MFDDITEVDVLEEGGFVFKANHPRLFHTGDKEFLPSAIGGSDGCLAIDLAGPVLLLAQADGVVVVFLNRGVVGLE